MTAYEEVQVYLHPFLTATRDGCEWLASQLGLFIPGTVPDTHLIGSWMGLRTVRTLWKSEQSLSPLGNRTTTPRFSNL